MEQKLSIHRALAELKLIDDRIEKSIQTIVPSGMKQRDSKVNQFEPEDDFITNTKSKYQSITDLIDRKAKIKSAIVKANANTLVTIGDSTMTIADAISMKSHIQQKKNLIDVLDRKHRQVKAQIEKNNTTVQANALELAKTALGKEGVKLTDADAVNVTKPYIESNEFHLVDPLNVDDLIEKLDEKVSTFEAEVDAVLSEVNATTFIEI